MRTKIEISNILQFVTLIGTLSVVWGYLFNLIFYDEFNFNVFPFMSFSEIIPKITGTFLIILTFTIYFAFVRFRNSTSTDKIKSFKKSLKIRYLFYNILSFILLIGVPIVKYKLNIFTSFQAAIFFSFVGITLFVLFNSIGLAKQFYFKKYLLSLNIYRLRLFEVVFWITLLAPISGIIEAKSFKSNVQKDSYIILEGKKIMSSAKFYFIGHTLEFIMFYDVSKNKTIVYPISKVQEFQIP